jgi:alkanesulfonate monooxygenase SsuD/methylene tetrahydromethanopterin reductase-like flavin-dependent oxidoreductase (luciferase family)
MLAGDRPSFTGKHYVVDDAINQPPPVGRIPVMIGGSGERKTLRMVAQYADESNLTCGPDEVGERLEAVRASGVDGVTCNLVANGHLPGRIELLGGAATAVFS